MALLFARRPGGQAERQFDREAGRAASCQLAPTKGKRREQIAEEAVAVTVARRRWLRQVCTCKPVPDSQLAPDHDHRGQPTAPTQHTHAPWAVARSTAHKNTSDVFDSRTCVGADQPAADRFKQHVRAEAKKASAEVRPPRHPATERRWDGHTPEALVVFM